MGTEELNEDLSRTVGTEEMQRLEAKPVRVEAVNVKEVSNKEGKVIGKKVACQVKHPDKAESVEVSSVKYEKSPKNLAFSGLWYKLDSQGFIQKGTALAALLLKVKAATVKELLGKELETAVDEGGYLAFKAY